MSFSISFFAATVSAARHKLAEVYAPGAVKALIEQALNGIPRSPATPARIDEVLQGKDAPVIGRRPMPRRFAGVLVETSGHIDDDGEFSWINKFEVRPVYE